MSYIIIHAYILKNIPNIFLIISAFFPTGCLSLVFAKTTKSFLWSFYRYVRSFLLSCLPSTFVHFDNLKNWIRETGAIINPHLSLLLHVKQMKTMVGEGFWKPSHIEGEVGTERNVCKIQITEMNSTLLSYQPSPFSTAATYNLVP